MNYPLTLDMDLIISDALEDLVSRDGEPLVARALLGILNICPGSEEDGIAGGSPPALDGQNLDRPLARCLDRGVP